MMSLTFCLLTQVSDSGPHGRLVIFDLHLDAKVFVSLAISALISTLPVVNIPCVFQCIF